MVTAGLFSRAATLKHHRLTHLSTRNLFSHISEGCKFKARVLLGLASPVALLLGLQMAPELCVLTQLSLCTVMLPSFQ